MDLGVPVRDGGVSLLWRAFPRSVFDSAEASSAGAAYRGRVIGHYNQLGSVGREAADNFENRAALVAAEIARLEDGTSMPCASTSKPSIGP